MDEQELLQVKPGDYITVVDGKTIMMTLGEQEIPMGEYYGGLRGEALLVKSIAMPFLAIEVIHQGHTHALSLDTRKCQLQKLPESFAHAMSGKGSKRWWQFWK